MLLKPDNISFNLLFTVLVTFYHVFFICDLFVICILLFYYVLHCCIMLFFYLRFEQEIFSSFLMFSFCAMFRDMLIDSVMKLI